MNIKRLMPVVMQVECSCRSFIPVMMFQRYTTCTFCGKVYRNDGEQLVDTGITINDELLDRILLENEQSKDR